MSDTLAQLQGFRPRHDAFVAIDSDGAVFPNMEFKFEVLCETVLRHWRLEAISSPVRDTARFVYLESVWRGSHRFPALLKTLSLLRERPEPCAAGVALPDLAALQRFVDAAGPLSNAALAAEQARTGAPELERVLAWSRDFDRALADATERLAPFAGARRALERMAGAADLAVVSLAPGPQLAREWRAAGIERCVRAIGGSEAGGKAAQIRAATAGRYDPGRVLVVGDAPGDRRAALAAGASFFPIVPGREADSWRRLRERGFAQFLAGTYRGAREERQTARFLSALPSEPPWASAAED